MKTILTIILLAIAVITIVIAIRDSFKNKNKNKNEYRIKLASKAVLNNKQDEIIIDQAKMINGNDDNEILNEMLDEFIIRKPEIIGAVERGIEQKDRLEIEIRKFLSSRAYQCDEEKIIKNFKTYIWGYGPLQPLINHDDISDIKTINENCVRIKELGKRKTSDVKFGSKENLKRYINFIAVKNGITLSEVNAVQRTTDIKSSDKFILRIDISSEYVNTVDYPYLHIRKIPKNKDSLNDLQQKGMLNTEENKYLNKAVKSGLSILACGKGGAGKTALINALIELIPHSCSGLVVQEAEELFSNTHPDLMFQKIKKSNGESNIKYTLADLIRNGLVSDNDYMIVGEIKGAEAWDNINAIYTGHISISSMHTSSAEEAPQKMVHYMKSSPNARDMKEADLLETLVGIDIIVFMKDFKINEITEIAGFDREKGKLILKPVFKYQISNNHGDFVRLNDSCNKVKEKIEYSKFKNSEMVK